MMPRSVVQTYSVEMERLIAEMLRIASFDAAIASEVYAPALVSLLASRISGMPKILDGLEVALAKEAYRSADSLSARLRNGLTWFKLHAFSRDILKHCDACTVPSEQEGRNLRQLAPRGFPIEIIPHSLDMENYQSVRVQPAPNSLVFTGSFTYHANLDAVRYFLGEIYPAIQKTKPNGKLKVLGSLNGVDPWTLPRVCMQSTK